MVEDYSNPLSSRLVGLNAWHRLAIPVAALSCQIAGAFGLPQDEILDCSARFLGFSNYNGLMQGLRVAARADAIRRNQSWGASTFSNDDVRFVEQLARHTKGEGRQGLEFDFVSDGNVEPVMLYDGGQGQRFADACRAVGTRLDGLRTVILYGFTCHRHVVSPVAARHARDLALALSQDATVARRKPVIEDRAWKLICDLRFGAGVAYLAEDVDDVDDAGVQVWSKQDREQCVGAMPEVLEKLLRAHEGHPSVVSLRNALRFRACAGNDVVREAAPPLYLALAHSPDHVRVKLEFVGGLPAIYKMYARSVNDLDDILLGSIDLPAEVTGLSLAEAESMGVPVLAGWYQVSWGD